MAVARASSFTRAAAQLGVSQSALSHTLRRLETALGLRLLTRTTRSVAPTEAGERLIQTLGPHFEGIDHELDALTALRDTPSGTLRINAGEHAVRSVLWPKLAPFLKRYPDIRVEIHVDNGYVDIVSGRYDAGVRLGEEVAGDMISVRIGSDWRMAVVATPEYFSSHGVPKNPARSHQTELHKSAADEFRRLLCLGVRARRAEAERPGGWPTGVQQFDANTARLSWWAWHCLHSGGHGGTARC